MVGQKTQLEFLRSELGKAMDEYVKAPSTTPMLEAKIIGLQNEVSREMKKSEVKVYSKRRK